MYFVCAEESYRAWFGIGKHTYPVGFMGIARTAERQVLLDMLTTELALAAR